jgi:hypothetical protein
MLLSTKLEDSFMTNSNYAKTYNSFAEHPLAPTYFKYIDILISKDLNYNVQYLLDIANAPLTPENLDIITKVIIDVEIFLKENFDDFDAIAELGTSQANFS